MDKGIEQIAVYIANQKALRDRAKNLTIEQKVTNYENNIPQHLKETSRWMLLKNGAKGYFQTRNSNKVCRWSDPSNWGTYEEGIEQIKIGSADYLAFIICNDIAVVDLDRHYKEYTLEEIKENPESLSEVKKQMELSEKLDEVQKYLDAEMPTYCERSKSGNGLHYLYPCNLSDKYKTVNSEIGIDMFDQKHVIVLTGDITEGSRPYPEGEALKKTQERLLELQAEKMKEKGPKFGRLLENKIHMQPITQPLVSDEMVIEALKKDKKGAPLYNNRWAEITKNIKMPDGTLKSVQSYGGQHFADAAFMAKLVYYTHGCQAQCNRIFHASPVGKSYGPNHPKKYIKYESDLEQDFQAALMLIQEGYEYDKAKRAQYIIEQNHKRQATTEEIEQLKKDLEKEDEIKRQQALENAGKVEVWNYSKQLIRSSKPTPAKIREKIKSIDMEVWREAVPQRIDNIINTYLDGVELSESTQVLYKTRDALDKVTKEDIHKADSEMDGLEQMWLKLYDNDNVIYSNKIGASALWDGKKYNIQAEEGAMYSHAHSTVDALKYSALLGTYSIIHRIYMSDYELKALEMQLEIQKENDKERARLNRIKKIESETKRQEIHLRDNGYPIDSAKDIALRVINQEEEKEQKEKKKGKSSRKQQPVPESDRKANAVMEYSKLNYLWDQVQSKTINGEQSKLQLYKRMLSRLQGEDIKTWLDTDVINVANGVLDLKNNNLKQHDKKYKQNKITNAAYDPKADCPEFRKFISQVFPNEKTRRELQKMLGLTLAKERMVAHKAFFVFLGEKNTGKSTLTNILRHVLGDYAGVVDAKFLTQTTKDRTIGPESGVFYDRRLVITSEMCDRMYMDSAFVKKLVGLSPLSYRLLYSNTVRDFVFDGVLLADANVVPHVKGEDDAMWYRLTVFPFLRTFAKHEQDSGLEARIKENETAGILNYILEGLEMLREDGGIISETEEMLAAKDEKRLEMSSVASFFAECVKDQPGHRTSNKVLFDAYVAYCQECEIDKSHIKKAKGFGLEVKALGLDKRYRKKEASTGVVYMGTGFTDLGEIYASKKVSDREDYAKKLRSLHYKQASSRSSVTNIEKHKKGNMARTAVIKALLLEKTLGRDVTESQLMTSYISYTQIALDSGHHKLTTFEVFRAVVRKFEADKLTLEELEGIELKVEKALSDIEERGLKKAGFELKEQKGVPENLTKEYEAPPVEFGPILKKA